MAIITISGTPAKGAASTVTLNKADLLAHPTVSADSYFSNDAVWKTVRVFYASTVGAQLEILTFDATQASPTDVFYVFSGARDVFQIDYLEIIDFQNGKLTVPRVDLTVEDFDVDFTSVSYLLQEDGSSKILTEAGDFLALN